VSQALFCRNSASNRLQRTVGLMMFASRVPVKILDVFAKLGVCQSYRSIQRQVVTLAADAQMNIRLLVASDIPWGFLYDNINYMDKVKHQSVAHQSTFTSAVVGNLILLIHSVALRNADYPAVSALVFQMVMSPTMEQPTARPRRLCQSSTQLKRSLQPKVSASDPEPALTLDDVVPNRALDKHLKATMVTHLINGFLNANPDLEHLRSQVPIIPAVFPLAIKKSTLYPLPLQRCDEAKIDGNIEYFRRILKHLDVTDKQLEDRIIPTFGDVFSVDRVRLGVAQCQFDKSSKYLDQFKFPEPFMGPFHLLVSSTGRSHELMKLRTDL
jgi:hypothetical protein